MPTNQQLVHEFHRRHGPPQDGDHRPLFRIRLLAEEFAEYVEATERVNLVATAKEIADCLYVLYGTADLLGVDIDRIFRALHTSNMTKEPMAGGKSAKGPGFVEIDWAEVIAACQDGPPEERDVPLRPDPCHD